MGCRAVVASLVVASAPAIGMAATYTPAQVRSAYGFNLLPSTVNGSGQTIAIIDFGNDPYISSDLATFDSDFGIAAPPSLTVENENGGSTLPSNDSSTTQETGLDVEYAHAIAPGANILLIEAPPIASATITDVTTSAGTAASKGASVVSMSFGFAGTASQNNGAGSGERSYDASFNHSGVTYVAASGDTGLLSYPASSPYVIGVGGTTLTINGSTGSGTAATGGTNGGEVVWNNSSGSGGGGIDKNEPIPSFQVGVASGSYRNEPDVAYDADPYNGYYVVEDGVLTSGVGGTSAGSPQWAGLIALADQIRASDGLALLSSTQALTALYNAYSNKILYGELFNDITSGNNSQGDTAAVGYDDVTGLGTPIANNVVEYLATGSVPEPTGILIFTGASLLLSSRRRRSTLI